MKENLQTAIQRAIDEAPERGFVESIEISFTIKDVDLKVPTNRIKKRSGFHPEGKPTKIAMFAGGEMAAKAKAGGLEVIDPTTIEDLGGNRQKARKIAKQYDFFLSEIPHMGTVGRFLGGVLGPRGRCQDRFHHFGSVRSCGRTEGYSHSSFKGQGDIPHSSRI